MSDSEEDSEKVCKYRKVNFEQNKFIYMSHGEVDLLELINVFWSSETYYNKLVDAAKSVSDRRTDNPVMRHGCISGQLHYFVRTDLIKTLEKVFRAAKVQKEILYEAIASDRWKILQEEITRNKVLCKYDYIKCRIDTVHRDLKGVDMEDFYRWNPDYKYVANTIVNLHKKRKLSKKNEDDDE